VGFIAATRLNIDFAHFNAQTNVFPPRILTACDTSTVSCAPTLNTLQQAMVIACTGVYWLFECETCYTPFIAAWRNAMSTDSGRSHGRDIIEQTFQDPSTITHNLKQIIVDYINQNSASQLASLTYNCLKCGPEVLSGIWSTTEASHVPGDCGSTFLQRALIPDEYGDANFGPCCRQHDTCYDTCGSTKSTCDNNFNSCLLSSCDSAYSSDVINLPICRAAGDGYAEAVRDAGDEAFHNAQVAQHCPSTTAGATTAAGATAAGQ